MREGGEWGGGKLQKEGRGRRDKGGERKRVERKREAGWGWERDKEKGREGEMGGNYREGKKQVKDNEREME